MERSRRHHHAWEQPVADLVPGGVVDALEVVDVEHQQGREEAVGAVALERLLETVGEERQRRQSR